MKALDRWYPTEGYSPIFPGYENLVGRKMLNQLSLCMRGPEERVYAATHVEEWSSKGREVEA